MSESKPVDQPAHNAQGVAYKYVNEPDLQRYTRQTRNALVFIAVVIGVLVVLSLIFGLIISGDLHTAANNGTGY